MERVLNYKKYLFLGLGILLLIISLYFYFKFDNNDNSVVTDNVVSDIVSTTKEILKNNTIYVDIKGSVKNPGVYEFNEGERVIDAINKAGGLSKNATTDNINLSKKLVNEMVVYVFNKSELTTTKIENSLDTLCKCETIEVNNCVSNNETNNNINSKININTDNKDKLMTLNGIGSSKADAIIEYRNKNGNFKSIEDIINVSGISSILYEKIKDNITV